MKAGDWCMLRVMQYKRNEERSAPTTKEERRGMGQKKSKASVEASVERSGGVGAYRHAHRKMPYRTEKLEVSPVPPPFYLSFIIYYHHHHY
jgi:hypothetical protein